MALRGYTHVEHVGDVKVKDSTSFAWQCQSCGECDLSLDDLAGYERRATALVLRDGHHVNGSSIRSARKALGLRQADLAILLGCEPETVSRWETGSRPMPRAEQLAVVALLDGVERGDTDLQALLHTPQGDDKDKADRKKPVEFEVLPRKVAG